MREIKSKKGHRVLKVSSDEVRVFGWFAPLCDMCNDLIKGESNYFIGVLNYTVCESCYQDWNSGAEFYEEDKWYEDKKIEEVRSLLESVSI